MFTAIYLLRKYYKNHINYGFPFASSQDNRVKTMMCLAKVTNGEKMVDLGSGDGKVVIAFAKKGVKSFGIEIDPTLVKLGKHNIRKNRLIDKAEIILGDFWTHPLNSYDIITIYGLNSIMGRLERKFQEEAKNGARILCNFFPLPQLLPETVQNNIYLYVKK